MPILRLAILALGVLASVLLIVSVQYSVGQWQNLKSSQAQFLAAENKVRMLADLEKQLVKFEAHQTDLKSIASSVEDNALGESLWSSKAIVVKSSVIAREEVTGFLKGISNQQNQWFKPEKFSLRTMNESDDLFQWMAKSSNKLELSLEGEYMLRRPL